MEHTEREQLIRRIAGRRLYSIIPFKFEEIPVVITDPSLSILCEADWVYDKNYHDNIDMMTLADSYVELVNRGLWSYEQEKELDQLKQDVKTLTSSLNGLRFKKAELRAVKKTIEEGKNRIAGLIKIKEQLMPSTREYFCQRLRRHFILRQTTEVFNKELLNDPSFLDALAVKYFDDSKMNEKNLRELARGNPWRLYWSSAKSTGMPLFPHSSVEMSDYQYGLVYWSKIYDFAYESTNRPDDSVINDDDRFDAWYEQEVQRIDNESKQNAVKDFRGVGSQETFIPADREGAKEVYALNDPTNRIKIASREKAIREAGALREDQLPDVKINLQMEMNKLASKETLNRSRR